jgi:hypothetical protein
MKKSIFIVLIIILVLIVALFTFYVYKNFFAAPGFEEATNQEMIGGQRDEYGCLIAAGYSWCEIKQQCLRLWEEYCGPQKNEAAFELLKNLRLNLELGSASGSVNNFDNPTDSDFDWLVEVDNQLEQVQISGLAVKAFETTTDIKQIENYLGTNGFEIDKYNVSAGTLGSSTGYVKDDLACLVQSVISEFNPDNPNYVAPKSSQPIPQNPDVIDITISCGYFKPSDISAEILLNQAIQNLFVEKYDLASGSFNINISQSSPNHLRGGITFLDKEGQPVGGGNFFAAKIQDSWQLVFDGNGAIPCTLLEEYAFPKEMQFDCYND